MVTTECVAQIAAKSNMFTKTGLSADLIFISNKKIKTDPDTFPVGHSHGSGSCQYCETTEGIYWSGIWSESSESNVNMQWQIQTTWGHFVCGSCQCVRLGDVKSKTSCCYFAETRHNRLHAGPRPWVARWSFTMLGWRPRGQLIRTKNVNKWWHCLQSSAVIIYYLTATPRSTNNIIRHVYSAAQKSTLCSHWSMFETLLCG